MVRNKKTYESRGFAFVDFFRVRAPSGDDRSFPRTRLGWIDGLVSFKDPYWHMPIVEQ